MSLDALVLLLVKHICTYSQPSSDKQLKELRLVTTERGTK